MTVSTETRCTDYSLKGVNGTNLLVNSPSPARIFNTVLFPLPFTPNTPTLAPLTKVKFDSSKSCRPPGSCFETLLKVSTGSVVSEDDPPPPPRPPPELAEPLFLPPPLFLMARDELMHRFESWMGGNAAIRGGDKSLRRVLLAAMQNRSLTSWGYDAAATVVLSNRSSLLGLHLLVLLQRFIPIPCDFLQSKTLKIFDEAALTAMGADLIAVLCRVTINILQQIKTDENMTHHIQSTTFEKSTSSPWSSRIAI